MVLQLGILAMKGQLVTSDEFFGDHRNCSDGVGDELVLSMALLARDSVTPDASDCLALLGKRLADTGFICEMLSFGSGNKKVDNLWAVCGEEGPVLCFVGHTDVVPTGDERLWRYPPFSPTLDEGFLYARGAADMKTAVACFVVACERFLQKHPKPKATIALLITGDEEGDAVNGTRQAVKVLQARGVHIDYCLVGEPSSTHQLGDVIKNGRRGSLNGVLTVQGKQGHVAYPHLAINPIHAISGAIAELCQTVWDAGNAYFLPTSFQISDFHAGTGAHNVIAKTASVSFNFRFSSENTAATLCQRTQAIIERHLAGTGASFELNWALSGEPFLTPEGELVQACRQAIKKVLGIECQLSTSGGTSDGRFIAPMGADVVELGVVNASIHQIDERVLVDDLYRLTDIYEAILVDLLH